MPAWVPHDRPSPCLLNACPDIALTSHQSCIREERLSFEALKKQAVVQHTLLQSAGLGPPLRAPGAGDEGAGDGGARAFDVAAAAARPEGRLWRTLEVMSPLLQTQQDPTGERYALTQLLHSWLPDLHATFLNYCLFEPDYAHQWPPALGTTGWSAFLTESKALGDGEGRPAPDPHALFARAAAGWRPTPPSVEAAGAGPASRPTEDPAGGHAGANTPACERIDFQSFCALLLHLAEACLPARPEDPGSPSFSVRGGRTLVLRIRSDVRPSTCGSQQASLTLIAIPETAGASEKVPRDTLAQGRQDAGQGLGATCEAKSQAGRRGPGEACCWARTALTRAPRLPLQTTHR